MRRWIHICPIATPKMVFLCGSTQLVRLWFLYPCVWYQGHWDAALRMVPQLAHRPSRHKEQPSHCTGMRYKTPRFWVTGFITAPIRACITHGRKCTVQQRIPFQILATIRHITLQ